MSDGNRKRNKNGGIRKRCGCPPKTWSKCQHPWHFNFKWKGVHYRLSLDREVGRELDGKSVALGEAERIRTAIRNGSFRSQKPTDTVSPAMTFAAFAKIWRARRGSQLVRPRDNDYRLEKITTFPLREGDSLTTFGDKPLNRVTTDDIERFRESRNREGLSPVTVNHDLKLLRKMLNWAVRTGYLERTPFKIGTETAISLEREIPRAVRFESDDDEQRLLDAADPHLRAVIIALLDTACRVGELLSLQWKNVSLERRELLIEREAAALILFECVRMSPSSSSSCFSNALCPQPAALLSRHSTRLAEDRSSWTHASQADFAHRSEGNRLRAGY